MKRNLLIYGGAAAALVGFVLWQRKATDTIINVPSAPGASTPQIIYVDDGTGNQVPVASTDYVTAALGAGSVESAIGALAPYLTAPASAGYPPPPPPPLPDTGKVPWYKQWNAFAFQGIFK